MTITKKDMKNVTAAFDELVANFQEQTKAFQKQAQEEFKKISKQLFDLCPELTAIKWNQYTPYFNDGEPCEFRVGSPVFTNAPDYTNVYTYGEYDGEYAMEAEETDGEENPVLVWLYGDDCYSSDRHMPPEYAPVFNAFESILSDSSFESVLKAMFDDHVTVTITRDGIDVEDYDHE